MVIRLALLTFTLLLAGVFVIVPTEATIGIDKSRMDLGKVPVGYEATRYVNVTNNEGETIEVETRVECECPIYVTATPSTLTLAGKETKQVRLDINVTLAPDPGIHDYQVVFTRMATAGSGGTGQGAIGLQLTFQVRSVSLYVAYESEEGTTYDLAENGTLGFRFVNGYEHALDVEVEGSVAFDGEQRPIGPVAFTARSGGERSAVTFGRIQTGLDTNTPPGIHVVSLRASWSGSDGEASGTTPERIVPIAIGASAEVRGFQVDVEEGRVTFTGTMVNTGGITLNAQLVVEVEDDGGQDGVRLESDVVTIPADGENTQTLTWEDARDASYLASAFARFRSAGEGSAYFAEGPRSEAQRFTVGKEAEVTTTQGVEGDGDASAGEGTTILIAAGVGLLVGAVIAFMAFRRRG